MRMFLLVSLLFTFSGCVTLGVNDVEKWAKEERVRCNEIAGHGVYYGQYGNLIRTDILRCPDGTLDVIPSKITSDLTQK